MTLEGGVNRDGFKRGFNCVLGDLIDNYPTVQSQLGFERDS